MSYLGRKVQISNITLDFIFLAHKPDHWQADSWILQIAAPIVDDNNRSDHRRVCCINRVDPALAPEHLF